jgi:hypothetical protein
MSTFTGAHTALSVAALIAGLIVVIGLFSSKTLGGWTAIFLATAIATSATGFAGPDPVGAAVRDRPGRGAGHFRRDHRRHGTVPPDRLKILGPRLGCNPQ